MNSFRILTLCFGFEMFVSQRNSCLVFPVIRIRQFNFRDVRVLELSRGFSVVVYFWRISWLSSDKCFALGWFSCLRQFFFPVFFRTFPWPFISFFFWSVPSFFPFCCEFRYLNFVSCNHWESQFDDLYCFPELLRVKSLATSFFVDNVDGVDIFSIIQRFL